MGNQLVMYEEELQQITAVIELLHRDANAKAVLVIDKNGHQQALLFPRRPRSRGWHFSA